MGWRIDSWVSRYYGSGWQVAAMGCAVGLAAVGHRRPLVVVGAAALAFIVVLGPALVQIGATFVEAEDDETTP